MWIGTIRSLLERPTICGVGEPVGIYSARVPRLRFGTNCKLLKLLKLENGFAEGGTRTPTSCLTRPSNVRVCQFRHFGMK